MELSHHVLDQSCRVRLQAESWERALSLVSILTLGLGMGLSTTLVGTNPSQNQPRQHLREMLPDHPVARGAQGNVPQA
jgi:hypothetical protein